VQLCSAFVNKVVNYWFYNYSSRFTVLNYSKLTLKTLQRCKIALSAVRLWCIHHDGGFSLWISVFYGNIKRIWAEHLSPFTERRQSAVNNPKTTYTQSETTRMAYTLKSNKALLSRRNTCVWQIISYWQMGEIQPDFVCALLRNREWKSKKKKKERKRASSVHLHGSFSWCT